MSSSSTTLQPCQLPPLLQPGDLAIAIATSGAVKSTDALKQGIAVWRDRGYHQD
jgi:muramoyltetrapeptide carboxypeptidase